MRRSLRIGTMLVAGAIGLVGVLEPKPVQAYWYGGYYGGYAARPYYWAPPAYYASPGYYAPYYRPRVLFVPPPVYLAPPVMPAYVRPPRATRPIRRARMTAPARDVCRLPGTDDTSPFAGAGEGVTPAAASGAEPLLGPLPGAPAPSGRQGISPFSRD